MFLAFFYKCAVLPNTICISRVGVCRSFLNNKKNIVFTIKYAYKISVLAPNRLCGLAKIMRKVVFKAPCILKIL